MQAKNFITLLVLFLSITVTAQVENSMKLNDDGANKNTKYIKLANGVYYLQGDDGGNIGVFYGKDDTFMVDSQTSTEINNNFKIIKRVNKNPIKYLVNTNAHPDHNGGNQKLSKEGALILSHRVTRDKILGLRRNDNKKVSSGLVPAGMTFTGDLTFHYKNEEIKIVTVDKADGTLLVYFSKNNVLFTGDLYYIKNKYPLIDSEKGESLGKVIKGLTVIKNMANSATKIVPGHGSVANVKEVNTSINMLTTIYKQVKSQRANGKTLDEVLNAKSTITGRYDNKGFGDGEVKAEDIIRVVYKELEREMGPLDKRTPQEKANDRLKEIRKGKN